MLSIAPVRGSMAAATYFAKDNYYTQGGEAPSAWHGRGAAALGLEGAVDKAVFERMLDGRITERVQIGRTRDGKLEHAPGWDLTFSAPKSVSLLAEIAGDRRLVAAHDAAVKTALDWLEQEGAVTRIRQGATVEEVSTTNLTVAVFRHDLSRAREPQLHSHAVVLNATQYEGAWRSLHSRALYELSKEAGIRYQHALAHQARQLGYDIETKPNGTFAIAGVSEDLVDRFSSRSRSVERWLESKGLDRESASGRQREAAAVHSRPGKRTVDREVLKEAWLAGAGREAPALSDLAAAASAHSQAPGFRDGLEDRTTSAALEAVRLAARNLAERDAAFAGRRLEGEAIRLSMGSTTADAIQQAIQALSRGGELVARMVLAYDRETRRFEPAPGWTTAAAIAQERRMLEAERAGRGRHAALLAAPAANRVVEAAQAASEAAGHSWTKGQIEATRGLLTVTDQVMGVQGFAGTAKTTTVLATVAHTAAELGYEVKGMAPTGSAALQLGQAIGQPATTLQRHIAELRPPAVKDSGKEAWIIDEASLVGASLMRQTLEAALRQGARVLLVGDVRQLASVEAGRAFGQLQEHGLRTFVLDEIVRQTNPQTLAAVEAAVRGDAARALARLDGGGGAVIEIGGRSMDRADALAARQQAIVRHYTGLSPEDRSRTIVLDPSRQGRDALNAMIRAELQQQGQVGSAELAAEILVSKGLTKTEAALALSYRKGDVVRFARAYHPKNQESIAKGEYLRVAGVDQKAGRVQLERAGGGFVVWQPASWGGNRVEAYRSESRAVSAGDRITWTRNEPSLGTVNGQSDIVASVDRNLRTITLDRGRAGKVTIDLSVANARHWDHGYVQTAYAAQGRTADRVIAHVESWRANLTNQRSFYVAISRAKAEAIVVTDDRAKLVEAIRERTGAAQAALDERAVANTALAAAHATRSGANAQTLAPTQAVQQDQERDRLDRQQRTLARQATKARSRDRGLSL